MARLFGASDCRCSKIDGFNGRSICGGQPGVHLGRAWGSTGKRDEHGVPKGFVAVLLSAVYGEKGMAEVLMNKLVPKSDGNLPQSHG